MNVIRRNIPNALTCGNLLCGCLALVKAFEGDLVWAAYLVGIALIFDFLDGFMARLLKVTSPIGKDLDSLADMVTFGVVPGVVMYQLFSISVKNEFYTPYPEWYTSIFSLAFFPFVAFMIPVFSAIRLARFNNDSRQSDSFIGLPTPANAVFFCSMPLFFKQFSDRYSTQVHPSGIWDWINQSTVFQLTNHYGFLVILTVVFSFLLIAPLPLFALKFKSFGWKGNEIRYVFLILSAGLIGFLQFIGIPLVIILYILMSVVHNLLRRSPN